MRISDLPLNAGTMIEAVKDQNLHSIDSAHFLSLLKENPTLHLKGFNPTVDSFFQFTESLGLNFMDYKGGAFHREEVQQKSSLLTVTGHKKGFPIPLHGELYYQSTQPDFLLFYCQSPALLGGASTVANAQKVYSALSDKVKKYLKSTKIKYVRNVSSSEWPKIYKTHDRSEVMSTCQKLGLISHFDSQENLITEYVSYAIVGSDDSSALFLNNILPNYYLSKFGHKEANVFSADGREFPEDIINAIEKACSQNTVAIKLKPKDLLFVNNRKALHGRKGFFGKREIFLRMGTRS